MAREKPADALAWLEARGTVLLGDRAVKVLNDLYTEAAWLGACVARAQVGDVRKAATLQVDWAGWKPGDIDAARLLIADDQFAYNGLKDLQAQSGFVMRGIDATRMDALSNALSDAVLGGLSQSATASLIKDKVGGTSRWANVVANTETRRAVTAATLDTYAAAGIEMKEWATAGNAVDECKEFEDDGPIPLDGMWGDVSGPPAHPNCLCVVMPVLGVAAPVTPSAEPEKETLEPEIIEPVTDEGYSAGSEMQARKLGPEDFLSRDEEINNLVEERRNPRAAGDPLGYALNKISGYDALPKIVAEEELESLVTEKGWTRVYRGVTRNFPVEGDMQTGKDLYGQYASSDFFPGFGIYGNGTYSATNAATSLDYTENQGAMWQMALNPESKVITHSEISRLQGEYYNAQRSSMTDSQLEKFTDVGYFALMQGYDAIIVPAANWESDFYVILNRGATAVQDRVLTDREIEKLTGRPNVTGNR